MAATNFPALFALLKLADHQDYHEALAEYEAVEVLLVKADALADTLTRTPMSYPVNDQWHELRAAVAGCKRERS